MNRIVLLVVLILNMLSMKAQDLPIPYTQTDRDRLVRVETKVEGLDKRMEIFESHLNRMEDKFDKYFMWGFGLVLMSIFGLIG